MEIHGKRLRLRDWQLGDLETYTYWLQPGHRWQALDGPYYPSPTVEKIPSYVRKIGQRIEKNVWPTPRQNLIISDKETGKMRGRVSWYWQSEETNWLSVGIVIYDPADWQQGWGYESLGLWCDYLLGTMPQLVRLDLRTWSGNTGMMRLAVKLGFREEARFRDARIVDGAYYDGMGYGMLRAEWEARYPQGFLSHLTEIANQPESKMLPKKLNT